MNDVTNLVGAVNNAVAGAVAVISPVRFGGNMRNAVSVGGIRVDPCDDRTRRRLSGRRTFKGVFTFKGVLMKRVLCRFPVLVVPGIVIGVLSAAPALADNPHVPLEAVPVSLPAEGYCGDFPVLITFPDFKQKIVRSTTAPDGTATSKITGHARATVTNQTTNKSVSFNISGPGTLVVHPDESFSADLAGPNLLWTAQDKLPDSPAGVPTISYTTGHVTFAVDASGKTTSYSLAGGNRQTDVCASLRS